MGSPGRASGPVLLISLTLVAGPGLVPEATINISWIKDLMQGFQGRSGWWGWTQGPPRPGCLWHTAVRQVSRPGGDQSLYWVVLQTQPAPKRQLEAKEHLG